MKPNEGLAGGIPGGLKIECHPGGDEPASLGGGGVDQTRPNQHKSTDHRSIPFYWDPYFMAYYSPHHNWVV